MPSSQVMDKAATVRIFRKQYNYSFHSSSYLHWISVHQIYDLLCAIPVLRAIRAYELSAFALPAWIIDTIFLVELFPRSCSAVFEPRVTSNKQTSFFPNSSSPWQISQQWKESGARNQSPVPRILLDIRHLNQPI